MGSPPATMEAGKAVDAYDCLDGNDIEQADAEQSYVQAWLLKRERHVGCDPGRGLVTMSGSGSFKDPVAYLEEPCVATRTRGHSGNNIATSASASVAFNP